MASSAVGATLTEQHRRVQLTIRASFLREFLRMWPLLNIERLDETTGEWINVVTEMILRWRLRSAERALRYYEAFRLAEAGEALPDPALYRNLADVNVPQIQTSLLVTGPIGYKSRIGKGFTPARAQNATFTAVSGSASRHVLNGGRSQLINTATKDEMAVGFSRVVGKDPCAFCAMLASRGPVYFSRATASRTTGRSERGAGEKYHDDCACAAEPSFNRETDWPTRNREFEQLWKDSTGGKGGKNALNAFRRAYEAQRKAT